MRTARAGRLTRVIEKPQRELLALAARAVNRVVPSTLPMRVKTFWGDRMHVVLPEPVSLHIFRFEFFEAELTSMLLRCVRPGDVFFDVGAHFGYYSMLASELVGDTGRVVSFEPTPSTFATLQRNLAGRANARAIHSAASDTTGRIKINDFGLRFSAFNSILAPRLTSDERAKLEPKVHDVDAWAIDDFVAQRGTAPTFVKIDAESAEAAILRGMRNVLREHRPMVTLEVGDMDIAGAAPSREIVDMLRSHDYVPYEFRDGEIVRHEPLARYGFANLLFAPADVSPSKRATRAE